MGGHEKLEYRICTCGKLTPHSYGARYLHSISEVNPDALCIAEAMDKERAERGIRSAMHGIPFLVKDNFYTDDKHNTSEGTLVLLGGRYAILSFTCSSNINM